MVVLILKFLSEWLYYNDVDIYCESYLQNSVLDKVVLIV